MNTTAHPRVYVPRSAKRKRGRPIKRHRRKAAAAVAARGSNIERIATPTATKDEKLKMTPKVICERFDSLPPRPRRSVHDALQIDIADDKLKLVPRVVCTRKIGQEMYASSASSSKEAEDSHDGDVEPRVQRSHRKARVGIGPTRRRQCLLVEVVVAT